MELAGHTLESKGSVWFCLKRAYKVYILQETKVSVLKKKFRIVH